MDFTNLSLGKRGGGEGKGGGRGSFKNMQISSSRPAVRKVVLEKQKKRTGKEKQEQTLFKDLRQDSDKEQRVTEVVQF